MKSLKEMIIVVILFYPLALLMLGGVIVMILAFTFDLLIDTCKALFKIAYTITSRGSLKK